MGLILFDININIPGCFNGLICYAYKSFTLLKHVQTKLLLLLLLIFVKCLYIQKTDLDYYNIEGNRNLGAVFMSMLNVYIDCLEARYLPNYFIR